jgi:Chaperone of endosialidase
MDPNLDQSAQNFGDALVDEFDSVRRGEGFSGLFPIDISGNAQTADKLKTARQINQVGFDGTQNIFVSALFASNQQKTLETVGVFNAVNTLQITNSAAGSALRLDATGLDQNVSISLASKNLGSVSLNAQGGVEVYPHSGGFKLYDTDSSNRWIFNIGNLTADRVINFPLDGDVTLVAGTMLTAESNQSFSGENVFTQPISVVNSFNINGSAPSQQRNGFYVADLSTTSGSTNNPVNTVAIAAQISSSRSIALSVDEMGFIWGYRSDSSGGPHVFQSKVKGAEKLLTSRIISISGDGNATGSFDGSDSLNLSLTLSNTGVTANTYNASATQLTPFTVNAKGLVVSTGTPVLITPDWGSIQNKPTTLAGYGITDTLTPSGDISVSGLWRFTNSTETISSSTGAVVVDGGVSVGKNLRVAGDAIISGDLIVQGKTITIDSENTVLEDAIITLGGSVPPTVDDGKDRGIEYRWYDGSSARRGFFGFDRSDNTFTFIPNATNVNEVISGTPGNIKANLIGNVAGNADTTTKLQVAQSISLTGDATWSVNFDGSAPVSSVLTLSSSGVVAGTYNTSQNTISSFTVDSKGRITAVGAPSPIVIDWVTGITNKPTTLADFGIGDVVDRVSNQTISGVKTFTNSTDASSVVVAGTVIEGGLGVAKSLVVGTTLSVGSPGKYDDSVLSLSASDSKSGATFTRYSNDGLSSALNFIKNRGNNPTFLDSVQIGDVLGLIRFQGANGSGIQQGAQVRSQVEVLGSGQFGSNVSIATTTTGNNGIAERMAVHAQGHVDIGLAGSASASAATLSVANTQAIVRASTHPVLTLRRSEGTLVTPTQTTFDSIVGSIQGSSYTNSDSWVENASIRIVTTENQTNSAAGSMLKFLSVRNGTTSPAVGFVLSDEGRLIVADSFGIPTRSQSANINAKFQTLGLNQENSSISATLFQNSSVSSAIVLAKSRGADSTSYTAVQSMDSLGSISFNAADGVKFIESALIQAYADGSASVDSAPTAIRVATQRVTAGGLQDIVNIRANGYIGINQANPQVPFHVTSVGLPSNSPHPYRVGILTEAEGSDIGGRIGIRTSNDGGEQPALLLYRSRGSIAAPTAVGAGDSLGGIGAHGHDGVLFAGGGRVPTIQFLTSQAWTEAAHGSLMRFSIVKHDTNTEFEAGRFDERGSLQLNATNNPTSDFFGSIPVLHTSSDFDIAARLTRKTRAAVGVGGISFAGFNDNNDPKDIGVIRGLQELDAAGGSVQIFIRPTAGPLTHVARFDHNRNVTFGSGDASVIPRAGYGRQLAVTQGVLRSTILQQSVNVNDERVYLLNNASPPSGAYTGTFVYDKTGAAATSYLQYEGAHLFSVAPIGVADSAISFTNVLRLDLNGMTMSGAMIANVPVNPNVMIGQFRSNTTNLTISGVGGIDSYITGTQPADTAIRTEVGNLALGAVSGATVVGTATIRTATFHANGRTSLGTSTAVNMLTTGGGITAIVGDGVNVANPEKGIWVTRNTTDFNGFGWQFYQGGGADMYTGNMTTAWQRAMRVYNSARVRFGGDNTGGGGASTPLADVHINQVGADVSGSLSLTGLAGPSYILMGNRDSGGASGPSVIVASNRMIQFGTGSTFTNAVTGRAGGTFRPILNLLEDRSVGISTTTPDTYGRFAVNLTALSGLPQHFATFDSPTSVSPGTFGAGFGIAWNTPGVSRSAIRIMHGGDFNNTGLGFQTTFETNPVIGVRISPYGWLNVGNRDTSDIARGSTLFPGQFSVSNNNSETYLISTGLEGYVDSRVRVQTSNGASAIGLSIDHYQRDVTWFVGGTIATGTNVGDVLNSMHLTATGRLGLSTNLPSARLSVGPGSGVKVLVRDDPNAQAHGFGADVFGGSTNQLSIFAGTNSAFSNTNIAFGAVAASNFATTAEFGRFQYQTGVAAGQFYIGTRAPWPGHSSRLALSYLGGNTEFGINLRTSNTSVASSAIVFTTGGSENGVGSPTIAGSIVVNGAVTSYNTSSDERIKTNIEPLGEVGSIIDSVNVREFEFRIRPGQKYHGFVAQELYRAYALAVTPGDDGTAEVPQNWSVDLSKLVPLVVREVQSLRKRVSGLEADKAQIESRLQLAERERDEHRQRIEALESAVQTLLGRISN